jgi:hypothetical protein
MVNPQKNRQHFSPMVNPPKNPYTTYTSCFLVDGDDDGGSDGGSDEGCR